MLSRLGALRAGKGKKKKKKNENETTTNLLVNHKKARLSEVILGGIERSEKRQLLKDNKVEAKDVVNLGNVAPKRIETEVNALLKKLEDENVIDRRVVQTPVFSVGSVHTYSTNVKSASFADRHVRKAIEMSIEVMIEDTTGMPLAPGLAIDLHSLDKPNKQVIYEIVDNSNSKPASLPTMSIDNDDDDKVVFIDPFEFPSNSDKSCHPSIRPHARRTGRGMAEYLIEHDCVNTDLANAPRIDERTTDKSSWGIYTKLLWDPLLQQFIIKKSGFTKSYLERREYYDPLDILAIFCDLSKLPYNIDIAMQYFLKDFVDGVRQDPKVPVAIKNLICEVIYNHGGGRFGGLDVLCGKLVEGGFGSINNEGVIYECLQFDDTIFFGMMGKVIETTEAVCPRIFAQASAQATADAESESIYTQAITDAETYILSSWKPAPHPDPHRADQQLFLTPIVSSYVLAGLVSFDGTNELPNAYDDVANPGAKTHEERWSTNFTPKQDRAALDKIQSFIMSDSQYKLLDSNNHCCSRAKTTMEAIIESESDYKKKVDIYNGRIGLYFDNSDDIQRVMQVHEPLCRSGNVEDYVTLDDNARGCVTAETMRAITLASTRQPLQRKMLAIEAAMAQRLYIDGLGQYRFMKGLLIREYLAPDSKAFDVYGGNASGPIAHYPMYPMASSNKRVYRSRI